MPEFCNSGIFCNRKRRNKMGKTTPMMEQYFQIKKNYKHCLLFFRLGDFYEMFFDDALVASKELEITLTGKDWGQKERAPMCGVPFHSAENYIAKLVEKGYNVAICEQTEDPKATKGIVKRDVIRVVTPGTILDKSALDKTKNNYIMLVFEGKTGYGIAICDVTTGEFLTSNFFRLQGEEKVMEEIAKYYPAELLCNKSFLKNPKAEEIQKRFHLKLVECEDWMFNYQTAFKKLCDHFHVKHLDGFGIKNETDAIQASGALLCYLYETQKNNLSHISKLKRYTSSDFMVLDVSSRRNLELTETIREKDRKGSLLWVLDQTDTAMGARMLRKWVEQPLLEQKEIQKRLDSVEELKNEVFLREELKEILNHIYDFERTMSKVIYQTANARDLIALKQSIAKLPLIKNSLLHCQSHYLTEIAQKLDTLDDVYALIESSIVEEPPVSVREGGMIQSGYSEKLDTYIRSRTEGKNWITELEEKEKEKTNIKNLKIRFNKVFGYYIEVTKSYLEQVPDRYIRKQTLANCERYMTSELNELAELILGAEEKMIELEYEIFVDIRNAVAKEVERIQASAQAVAIIDTLKSLAETAENMNYVKPVVNTDGIIDIQNGRHPVVEKMIKEPFIPNNTYLDMQEERLSIITGPNMAGKSTYMRQTALIVFMAQMGSFVPAESATIGIVDRIFTRVGASDDLSAGQSTFMVEMIEVANILNNASKNSLLILDEIGRGTSTFDGLSIAWAVLEYIVDQKKIGAKTLFATHYHELTELEDKLLGVKNYRISVEEQGEDIIFLRKIERGGANNSYGIQVAKLAGLPIKVIRRSSEILKQLNAADINKKAKKIATESQEEIEDIIQQVDMFTMKETQIIEEISELDIMAMTPVEALQTLFNLQKKVKGM